MDTQATIDPTDLFSAKGLVVVISGGGSGIGLSFAASLIKTGAARVYLLGRRASVLQDAAASLGATATALECDVTDASSISRAAAQITQETGYVDVLINNAGILGPDHKPANTASTIDELQSTLQANWGEWDATFAVNASAVVGVSAAFLKLLDAGNKRRGWPAGRPLAEDEPRVRDAVAGRAHGIADDDQRSSQIITVASIAGLNRYITAGLAYSGSKAAAIHLSKSLAHLLAPWGIRCNVVNPGIFPSDMTAGSQDTYGYKQVPAGRKGSFQDVAGTILYLVGKGGAYINGNIQVADGGRLSVMPATY
ncbi:SDR family NAD(P)-dependent oxidoreductase [Aspergillus homomorphus CBS 101889]